MVQKTLRILSVVILGIGSLCLAGCGPGKLDPAKEALRTASPIVEYRYSVGLAPESNP